MLLAFVRSIACGFAVLVLATTSPASAAIFDDPDPNPVAVFNTFAEALNTQAVDRAQALLADAAIISDERGEYVGEGRREWLVRSSSDGLHIRLTRVSSIDTDERGTPGYTTSWLSFTVSMSWEIERKLSVAPHAREASAIVQGGLIHSFRLQPLASQLEQVTNASDRPSPEPAETAYSTAGGVFILSSIVAVIAVLAWWRRVRSRPRVVTSTRLRMLDALHRETLRGRAARRRQPQFEKR